MQISGEMTARSQPGSPAFDVLSATQDDSDGASGPGTLTGKVSAMFDRPPQARQPAAFSATGLGLRGPALFFIGPNVMADEEGK